MSAPCDQGEQCPHCGTETKLTQESIKKALHKVIEKFHGEPACIEVIVDLILREVFPTLVEMDTQPSQYEMSNTIRVYLCRQLQVPLLLSSLKPEK